MISALLLAWRNGNDADKNGSYAIRPLLTSLPYPDNTMHYALAALSELYACLWSSHAATNISLFQWPSGDEISQIQIRNYNSPRKSYLFSQMIFSPDGQSLLWTVPDGSVALQHLNLAAPSESEVVWIKPPIITDGEQEPRFFIGRLCFSPDGTLLAYRLDNTLRLFRLAFRRMSRQVAIAWERHCCRPIGFSLTGRELVVYGANPYISVYRVDDLLNT